MIYRLYEILADGKRAPHVDVQCVGLEAAKQVARKHFDDAGWVEVWVGNRLVGEVGAQRVVGGAS